MRFSQDVEAWHGYLSRMAAEWSEHTAGESYVWAPEWQGSATFERAFVGAWQNIRGKVTREFRQWIEEGDVERITITTWIARARADRERERIEWEDWLDSQPF